MDKGGDVGAFDQGLLNAYFESKKELKRHMLPIYNWKVYWKIGAKQLCYSFHGPKPGKGLEAMASCYITGLELVLHPSVYKAYDNLLNKGICCDRGRTATWAMGYGFCA